MDYDRNDAVLHWIFRQTQGDAWFRPTEEAISSGVALRVNDFTREFRIFPYETPSLEPFEAAVAALNPLVAVKVRSAAVHAALAEVSPDDTAITVDSQTQIQILDSILLLPHADREQSAAFIVSLRIHPSTLTHPHLSATNAPSSSGQSPSTTSSPSATTSNPVS
jgi:hypothetical protein